MYGIITDKARYQKYLKNIESKSYDDVLEILQIEFGDFLRDAHHGKHIKHSGLKARKKSIKIRDLLFIYRKKSLEREKELSAVVKKRRSENKTITEVHEKEFEIYVE